MTAQILAAELSTIISESKKKHADIRGSAEKSAQDLKALPQTSEAQLAGDLRRRPHFPSPFLSACRTSNAKLALAGVTCLQRLIVSQGLAPERLQDALEALQECSKISLDVQLKILQSLPSLLQNYVTWLEGDLQAKTFEICTILQQVKSGPVSSTASATLQQIVSSVFEKVEREDDRANDSASVTNLDLSSKTVRLSSAAHDAYRILSDICMLIEGKRPSFVNASFIGQAFGLELIEAILTNNGELFDTHDELLFLLRTKIMPLIIRFLSERSSFACSVRITRILCIVLREHLEAVTDDLEIALGLLVHSLDADTPDNWRRASCMETFRIVYSVPNLATTIFSLFDDKEGRRNIIQENLSVFVRLAAEKPALIGLGQQSSSPAGSQAGKNTSQEQAVLEASGAAGVISGEMGVTETNVPGISTQWSAMKPPCLEQLDKSDPPFVPETYVYSLVLTCLTALSDGLAKTILPLTAVNLRPNSKGRIDSGSDIRKPPKEEHASKESDKGHSHTGYRNVPVNPRDLTNHQAYPLIETIAKIVDTCWPAILATSSTFLNAALDAEYYRGLIRSVQRFTQLAGLLRLSTPRDAFMTTLAKSAVPPHLLLQSDSGVPQTPSLGSPRTGSGSGADGYFGSGSMDSSSVRPHSRRSSVDAISPSMSQRNLMCLRALINIAIATGSILDRSWSIVVEALQKADSVLAQSGTALAREYRSSTHGADGQANESSQDQVNLTSEISAVEAATTRLFTSTGEYPNDAFAVVLNALCSLLGEQKQTPSATALMPATPMLSRRSTSMQIMPGHVGAQARTLHFALSKIGDLARTNINRLCGNPDVSGWTLLMDRLAHVSGGLKFDATARLMAADIRASVALGITLATLGNDAKVRERVQLRALGCLEDEVRILYEKLRASRSKASNVDMDVHRSAIEAVRSILENCGDSLVSGWRSIFAVINSAFTFESLTTEESEDDEIDGRDDEVNNAPALRPMSPRIARAAFDCVQLICSDFLPSLKRSRVVILVEILFHFCAQSMDLNISLTTLTLFWNLSDHLQKELVSAQEPRLGSTSPGNLTDVESIREHAEIGDLPAIYLFLQVKLASATEDTRNDVKTGAIQTIFRILGTGVDISDEQAWQKSFGVLLRLLDINLKSYVAGQNAATRVLFHSLAEFFTAHREAIAGLPTFRDMWQALLGLLIAHLELDEKGLQALAFDALAQMVPPVTLGIKTMTDAAGDALTLWVENAPLGPKLASAEDLDQALIAYIQLGLQIYPLVEQDLHQDQVKAMAHNLSAVTMACPLPPYTSDVDHMTTLQSSVLDLLLLLRSGFRDDQSLLIQHLASFVKLPYRKDVGKGQPTFSAFAKRAQTIGKDFISDHADSHALYQSRSIPEMLEALTIAIKFRYSYEKQGREPLLWKCASEAASDIIVKMMPLSQKQLGSAIDNDIWWHITSIKRAMRETNADDALPINTTLIKDETFDLELLARARRCTGIYLPDESPKGDYQHNELDNEAIDEDHRKSYVHSLYRASLIHDEHASATESPLVDLCKIRSGRVYDPPFHPRIRICYASVDEMFAIVGTPSNQAERSMLARTTMPYLLLRCALPLKRYIADQPLRGKMPTPMSQRLELLYLLKKMRGLGKKELGMLLPLVGKATGCSRADPEMAAAVQDVLSCLYQISE